MSTQAIEQGGTSIWNVDPVQTVAEFKVRHMAISNVKGQFAKVTGSLALGDSHPAKAHVEATIDVNSIETRDTARDTHLKSADFFDVEIPFAEVQVHQSENCSRW